MEWFFLFQIMCRILRLEKSMKIVAKSSVIETKQTFGSIMSNCIRENKNCLQFYIHCFLLTSFLSTSFSYAVFGGPLETTFSSLFRSSGLHCARELRASNLKHKDWCFHHLQILFVVGNIVRQLDSSFYFFD